MTIKAVEANFDGLVGPTHNYGGLAFGNFASKKYAHITSYPRAAALQGLSKMYLLLQLGIPQGILPPHERPNIALLKSLGFLGTERHILKTAAKEAPKILRAAYSASNMWSANAATVTPSIDCRNQHLQFTPANLVSHLHRAQETTFTYRILHKIFHDESKFQLHAALPATFQLADEGAANHNRFCASYGSEGYSLFVYGRKGFEDSENMQGLYLPRQTLEASEAIARLHQMNMQRNFFVQQNPIAIDKGVFHNDVISLVNQNVCLYHEEAFLNGTSFVENLKQALPFQTYFLKITSHELSLEEAVQTYLFNSQLVSLKDGEMALIAPEECRESKRAFQVLSRLLAEDNPIKNLHFVDCRQSMQNGGGPACLRLRIVLTEEERKSSLATIWLDEVLYKKLVAWVERHYREELSAEDLLDPHLMIESREALDALTQLLGLGSIYPFQHV